VTTTMTTKGKTTAWTEIHNTTTGLAPSVSSLLLAYTVCTPNPGSGLTAVPSHITVSKGGLGTIHTILHCRDLEYHLYLMPTKVPNYYYSTEYF
jgi:hypothetical protein